MMDLRVPCSFAMVVVGDISEEIINPLMNVGMFTHWLAISSLLGLLQGVCGP
jgi:hypothetical protein